MNIEKFLKDYQKKNECIFNNSKTKSNDHPKGCFECDGYGKDVKKYDLKCYEPHKDLKMFNDPDSNYWEEL